jgi:hypothetical protein
MDNRTTIKHVLNNCQISERLRGGLTMYAGFFIAEYNSASEASRETLTRCSCIVQCINPKYNRTTANNFIWKRKEIYG